jgi:glycosyltransferase involved in cell wall biosynthesis
MPALPEGVKLLRTQKFGVVLIMVGLWKRLGSRRISLMIFSVVVPFLNEEHLIEQCIRSLLHQAFDKQQYELIFVDNGSTDRSTDIVRSYQTIRLLYEQRHDPYLARNHGIRVARGQFIAFTDADCVADSHWLSELWHKLRLTKADIVLGRLLYPAPASVFLRCYEHYYHTKTSYIFDGKLRQYFFGHAGNMAMRASVFDKTGLFSGMPIVGDTEVIHRFMQYNPYAKIGYAKHAKVIHAEVTHFGHCLRKLFQCGQYSETYRNLSSYRPLNLKEQFQVFKACITKQHYGALMTLILGGTLLIGWLFFVAGRWLQSLQTNKFQQT